MSRQKSDDLATELLIREVDEDLKQERLHALWKRYGSWLIVAALAVILTVAGWQVMSTLRIKAQNEASQSFALAMELLAKGELEEARAQLEALIIDAPEGYQLLATLKLADVRAKMGDIGGAMVLYSTLPDGTPDFDVYKSLATLKSAYLKLDTDQSAEATQMVEPLAQEHNPWRFSAWEVQAIAAVQQGDWKTAVDLWQRILAEPIVPVALRTRTRASLNAQGKIDSEPTVVVPTN